MTDDLALAAALAQAAGQLLKQLQDDGSLQGRSLGEAGDRAANALLMDRLRTARPNDAILSEEEKDDAARLSASRVWIIDPLDGTREFSERRDDWAVHVALAIDGLPALGAVALPGQDLVLTSAGGQPAPPPPLRPRMLVSRTRPPASALAVAEAVGADLVPMGSAGAKAMAVVQGHAEIYLHSGGQYEWDNCAPAAVAVGHGLHASRVDGSALRYNNADAYVPDLLICRPEWASRVLALCAQLPAA